MTSPLVPSRTSFQIKYDGPAVADGAMSIDDLVPALLSVNNLIETTNRELNGSLSKVRVTLDKTTRGSVIIDVGIFQTLNEGLPYVTASIVTADALRGLLFGAGGLFELKRRARGREIKKVSSGENGESALVQVTGDNTRITINNNVYNLSQNEQAARAVDKVLKPLEQQGIDSITLTDGETYSVWTRNDLVRSPDSWIAGTDHQEDRYRPSTTRTVNLEIISPVFHNRKNKWRFLLDGDVLYADIRDIDFWVRVDTGQFAFSRGDRLRCDLQTIYRPGRRPTHSVMKVHSYGGRGA